MPSHWHWPEALQCCPATVHVPFAPVQMPPAPSDAPQAFPVQFGCLQTPWSTTNGGVHAWALQLPAPSHVATVASCTVVHGVPSGAAGCGDGHFPVADTHVPSRWHWSLAVHVVAGPAAQTPSPLHVSGVVHALLSALQLVPEGWVG